MDLKKLAEPFKEDEIEWRLSRCGESNGKIWGRCLAYITARAVMDRLDEVCGPENWKVSYEILPAGTMCTLSIKVENEWISKQDGAEPSDIEKFKGAISGALKRAAASWNIGRYLYSLEEGFVTIVDRSTNGAKYGSTKERVAFYWVPPRLPDWALPKANVEAKKPVSGTIITPKGGTLTNGIKPTIGQSGSADYRSEFDKFSTDPNEDLPF